MSDVSSVDFQSSKRPSDPSLDPTFTDCLDALDAMMQPAPHRVTTLRKKWDGYKAFVANGAQIVDWLVEHSFAYTTESAAQLATKLVRVSGLIPLYKVHTAEESFQSDTRYTYVHRGLTMMSEHGLNVSVAFPGKARDICAVLSDLNVAFAQVCHTSVSVDGHFVEYSAIRGSAAWRKALVLLAELAVCDDSTMKSAPASFKQASFYNLYNILIFHAKLVYGHPTDLLKRSRFFNEAAYIIAGKKITSVELEHAVCRRTMAANDERFSWVLEEKDPRMHFILNCGAQSCPPLLPLEIENVDLQLQKSTSNFIQNNCDVSLTAKTVTLSRLWKWFRPDFTPSSTSDGDLIRWISERASDAKKKELAELTAGDYKIKFKVYNWADNGDVNAKPDVRFMAVYDISFAKTV
ncbi:Winged helix-like DNA-binding [Gracilaria domingensis]|nr:Winged helix-like DNA-binding [Gracilaria domingensis]